MSERGVVSVNTRKARLYDMIEQNYIKNVGAGVDIRNGVSPLPINSYTMHKLNSSNIQVLVDGLNRLSTNRFRCRRWKNRSNQFIVTILHINANVIISVENDVITLAFNGQVLKKTTCPGVVINYLLRSLVISKADMVKSRAYL